MNNKVSSISIANAVDLLNKEEVIAYPTESVFSLGCDPNSEIAVKRLLQLKQRSINKGFILIAADYMQLKPYIYDVALTKAHRSMIFSAWPGPITFVFPAKKSTPNWLVGCFNSLAVRITNHPLVIEFCRAFGKPIITTSANISGTLPCRTVQEVYLQFGHNVPVINGRTGGLNNTSNIKDILTGKYLRFNNI